MRHRWFDATGAASSCCGVAVFALVADGRSDAGFLQAISNPDAIIVLMLVFFGLTVLGLLFFTLRPLRTRIEDLEARHRAATAELAELHKEIRSLGEVLREARSQWGQGSQWSFIRESSPRSPYQATENEPLARDISVIFDAVASSPSYRQFSEQVLREMGKEKMKGDLKVPPDVRRFRQRFAETYRSLAVNEFVRLDTLREKMTSTRSVNPKEFDRLFCGLREFYRQNMMIEQDDRGQTLVKLWL